MHSGESVSVCAHCQGVLVLLQGCDQRVRVIYVHRIAPALCVGQPQQQRMEALVELLHVCVCVGGNNKSVLHFHFCTNKSLQAAFKISDPRTVEYPH